MLTLSKRTDYALMALSYLVKLAPTQTANTREIAEKHDIPVELMAKILQRLARNGMVVSTSGPTGGYRLARAADGISIASVIEAVDGRPALAQCLRTDHTGCEQHGKCTIRKPLERINARMFAMLDLISLAEINREEDYIPLGLAARPAAGAGEFGSRLS